MFSTELEQIAITFIAQTCHEAQDREPNESHENWMKCKIEDGWVYGSQKDPFKKTHPCLVPFEDLPFEQQFKDKLFKNIVDLFKSELPKAIREGKI